MKTQKHPIGNDVKANVLQINLAELFELAHEHPVRAELPAAADGMPRDIVLVDDGTNVYLCVKTSRGWFRTTALTAL